MTLSLEGVDRRLFQLETLYEIGRECTDARTPSEVLQVVLSSVMGAFGAVGGLACLGGPDRLEHVHARGLPVGPGEAAALALALLDRPGAPPHPALEAVASFAPEPGAPLGAIALGARLTGEPYTVLDHALLKTIVANAQPYLENRRLLTELRARTVELDRQVRALTVANEVALGLSERPTAARLNRFLLERIASAFGAPDGRLGLVDEAGAWGIAAHVGGEDVDDATPLARFVAPAVGAPTEAVEPIVYRARPRGALWLRRPDRPFDDGERRLLGFLAIQAASLLESGRLLEEYLAQQREHFRLRGVLEQYLAPSVADRLIAGPSGPTLGGARVTATVLMVDMRGSSELTNLVGPEEMVRLLNQYFGAMTDAFFAEEGTIDKFEGDGLIGFFGAPERHDDDPLRAMRTGAAMHRAFDRLRAGWARDRTLPASLGIGVGIATGEVVIGNIGSAKRIDHTVIGAAANLAPRLASGAAAGTIHMDVPTWQVVAPALGRAAARRRPWLLRAKGYSHLVPIYRLRADDVPAERPTL